ncbi:hypothetical protein MKEN_01335600 [Mycena kentingensis (nom. inval.)]|nr:hypothetical protein MKEN_01335600 [Mycena kentingensis (nom. inval.)]
MFNNASNVSIYGGTFINSPQQKAPYRAIPIGDVDLLKTIGEVEVHEDRSVVQMRRRRRTRVVVGKRRVYLAQVFGSDRMFTVVEQDPSGTKVTTTMMNRKVPRHPSVAQLFGITEDCGINSFVYHDLLVPLELVKAQVPTPIGKRVLEYTFAEGFDEFRNYWRQSANSTCLPPCTQWFRPATGRLCVEIGPASYCGYPYHKHLTLPAIFTSNRIVHDEEILVQISLLQLMDILIFSTEGSYDADRVFPIGPCSFSLGAVYQDSIRGRRERKSTVFPSMSPAGSRWIPDSDYPAHLIVQKDVRSWARIDFSALPAHSCSNLRHPFESRVHLPNEGDIWKAWMLHALDAFSANSPTQLDNSSADTPIIITSLTFEAMLYYSPYDLRGTFMDDAPKRRHKRVYLFLFPVTFDHGADAVTSVNVPSFREGSAYFFSFCPRGSSQVSREELDALDIVVPEVHIGVSLAGKAWRDRSGLKDCMDILRRYCAVHGLEPDPLSLIEMMGLPRAMWVPDNKEGREVPLDLQVNIPTEGDFDWAKKGFGRSCWICHLSIDSPVRASLVFPATQSKPSPASNADVAKGAIEWLFVAIVVILAMMYLLRRIVFKRSGDTGSDDGSNSLPTGLDAAAYILPYEYGAGIPAVYLPYPTAAHTHQTRRQPGSNTEIASRVAGPPRSSDTDSGGRRLGLDEAGLGSKDDLPVYEAHGGPPAYIV